MPVIAKFSDQVLNALATTAGHHDGKTAGKNQLQWSAQSI